MDSAIPAPSFAFQTSGERSSQEDEEAEERKFIIGICAGIGFCVGFVILCCCLWKMCCSDTSDQKDVKMVNNRLKVVKTSRNEISCVHGESEMADYSARRQKVIHKRPLPTQVENMELTHNGAITGSFQNGVKRKRMASQGYNNNNNTNRDSVRHFNETSKVSHQLKPKQLYGSQNLSESNTILNNDVSQSDSIQRPDHSKRTKGGFKNPAFETDQQDIRPHEDYEHHLSADYDMGDYNGVARAAVQRPHRKDKSNSPTYSQKRHLEEDSDEEEESEMSAYEFYRRNRNARPKKTFQS